MRRIDHAEAASDFIAAKEHQAFHDRRLWDLRLKRDREAHGIPEWEELRNLASLIKEHTLSRLADYLEEFEARAKENGAQVHWARDATEHNQIVFDILSAHGGKTLVKSKSMLTEECDMRPFLERRDVEVIETASSNSTTNRRATSWCQRSINCAVMSLPCLRGRSERSLATRISTIWRRPSVGRHALIS
jgi:L-lactate utilization protein LutB